MSESRSEGLRKRIAAHEVKSKSFAELCVVLRVIAWDSPLEPASFDAAGDAVAEFAAKAYGIFPPESADASPAPPPE